MKRASASKTLLTKGITKTVKDFSFLIGLYGFKGAVAYLWKKFFSSQKSRINDSNKLFLTELYKAAEHHSDDFKEQDKLAVDAQSSQLKTIAFYLPQFHECEINNKAWGKGFTEWTNVTRAKPQFLNHYQPRLPGELGFYDLTHPANIEKQITIAKHHGLSAFCFHYYWFSGEKILFEPIQSFLEVCPPDFQFMINWANENWTRRWDGHEDDVIIENKFENLNIEHFFKDLLPIFKHPQYQMYAPGIPWLAIYRPSLLDNPSVFANKMRELARASGFKDLHLSMCLSFDQESPEAFGFDSAIEFPPHGLNQVIMPDNHQQVIINEDYEGQIYDCTQLIEKLEAKWLKAPESTKPIFRTIFPSWDNEARKPGKGHSFIHLTPRRFLNWLSVAAQHSKINDRGERTVFINAWNEWAEGAYLEPDRKYGFAYLNKLSEGVRSYSHNIQAVEKSAPGTDKKDFAIVIHLYYTDLAEEILQAIDPIKNEVDLYITVPRVVGPEAFQAVKNLFPQANLIPVDNRGRDVLPFLQVAKDYDLHKYKGVCKIHSKKSLHRVDGDAWRRSFLDTLFNPQLLKRLEQIFGSDTQVGLVAPKARNVHASEFVGSNLDNMKKLSNDFNIQFSASYTFVAGTMFWMSGPLLKQVLSHSSQQTEFETEAGQLDGTLAHAYERFFGLLCEKKNMRIESVEELTSLH